METTRSANHALKRVVVLGAALLLVSGCSKEPQYVITPIDDGSPDEYAYIRQERGSAKSDLCRGEFRSSREPRIKTSCEPLP